MYIGVIVLDMNQLSIDRSCAVDARVVITSKHEHLVIGLSAELTTIADIHLEIIQ